MKTFTFYSAAAYKLYAVPSDISKKRIKMSLFKVPASLKKQKFAVPSRPQKPG